MIFTPHVNIRKPLPIADMLDDASESSTFSVGFSTTPKRRRTNRLVKKSVAFDESQNTIYECQHSENDFSDTWFTVYEVQGFRTLNAFSLKKMERESSQVSDNNSLLSPKAIIDHTYTACQGMLFDDIEVLCPVETAQLRQALANPCFPAGLASYASTAIRRDVRARRRQVVETVQLIQHQTAVVSDTAVRADYIRQSAEAVSRPSRIFAQLIAENQCEYFW